MADRYLNFANTAPGRFLTRRLGLPQPAPLRRWSPEHPSLPGPLLHLTAAKPLPGLTDVLAATGPTAGTAAGTERPGAVVLDATGVETVAELTEVYGTLHARIRTLRPCARVVLLGAPLSMTDHHQAAAQQGLEGFARSLAKEVGRGSTVNLVRTLSAEAAEPVLRFLLSPKSAYVSGQVIEADTTAEPAPAPADLDRPLAGRTALVTGAARGIGASVAETLARDGARVTLLDVPSAEGDLTRVAARLHDATPLPLDITSQDAASRITAAFGADGLDVLVHNAGITRDRKLANMSAEQWSSVLEVNLASVLRTTDALLSSGTLRRGGSVVATSSISGIAGNAGQTNYAASKAGIIGLVRSLAPRARQEHGVAVNAVAPGFIETRMTAAVPFLVRETGRRLNSLGQGGRPVDVAETVAWLAQGGVTGQVLRVCGQSLLGA